MVGNNVSVCVTVSLLLLIMNSMCVIDFLRDSLICTFFYIKKVQLFLVFVVVHVLLTDPRLAA